MLTPLILLLKPENYHFLYRDVVSVDVVPIKKGCFRRGVERKNLKHDRFALVVDVLDPFCCHQPLLILYRPQQEKIYLFISEDFFGIRGDTVKNPVSVDVSFKSEPIRYRSMSSTFRLARFERLCRTFRCFA